MTINQIKQYSAKDKIWLSEITISTTGMDITINGTAYIKGIVYTLNATIPFTSPVTGTEHHIITMDDTGTIVVDPVVLLNYKNIIIIFIFNLL